MTNPLATVEDQLLADIKSVLGASVRDVGPVPGGWTMETLKRALQRAPGAYVGFLGGVPGVNSGYLEARWTIYTVSKGVDDIARRRGTANVIGAYDMLNALAPHFDGLTIAGAGTLQLKGIDNLFRDAMFELGGTVYAINLTLPNMPFDFEADLSAMGDFLEWHADHYAPGGIAAGDAPLATDDMT